MRYDHALLTVLVSSALLSSGPAEASIFKKVGHAFASEGRKIYREGDKINKKSGKTIGNVASKFLDMGGSVLDRVPVINQAGVFAHDAAKAVKSDAAHYGALGGLAVVATGAAPLVQGTIAGSMAGYYGRQVYLGARCAPKETAACKRLEAKP